METPGRNTLIVAPPTPAGSKTLYYVEDHLGTVRVVTDETGTKANAEFHDYEPFGVEIPPSTNVAENTHQYTGQERDAATQMDYMHFRYYGSNLGRFLKPDNINGNPMNPQDWNLYSYVHGNPVNFNDPTGHGVQHDKEGPDTMSEAICGPPPKQQKELGKGEAPEGPTPGMVVTGAVVQVVAAAIPSNPIADAGKSAVANKLAEVSGSSEGSQGLEDTKTTLEAGGTLLAEVGLVHASTAVVTAETATQAAIAASGGTAEAVTAGCLGSGLTTATGAGLGVVAFGAGYAVGTVINNQLPASAQESIGNGLLAAVQSLGFCKDL